MCNHIATPSSEQILEAAPHLNDFEQPELYHINGFRPNMPAVAIQTTEEPEYVVQGYWRLVPHWVKDISTFRANTLNARSEDIFTTNSYKSYIGKYRALVWVNGFYEYQTRVAGDKSVKAPYFIYMADRKPFTLGAVVSEWDNKNTFSIITTAANEFMSEIHNERERMPLIIEPHKRELWLKELPAIDIQAMMQPLPDGQLIAHTVSRGLSQRKEDYMYSPDIQEYVPFE